ncbi:MAG: putative AAA+ superfamily ATPase [Patescibacteria group bacterium]|jgi:predicted AAA+ superfamily ATPase
MKDTIKEIIIENQEKIPATILRDVKIPKTNKIIAIIGPRRVGKSHIIYQEMKKQDKEEILYINFEDERLLPLQTEDLDLILQSYAELYPKKTPKIYFDEIQEIPGWEKFIRRIYDTITKDIIVTGSSAKLLSKEIATTLRGRSIPISIYPLSFAEFLEFKGKLPTKKTKYTKKAEIQNEFQEYMHFGGFPEIPFEELKLETLSTYLDLTIYKDLIERHNIRNRTLLKDLIKYIITNISKEFSVNSYYKNIKQKQKVSKDTLFEYMNYIEDIGLIFQVPKHSYSLKEQQVNPPKVYIVDTGFFQVHSFKFSENKGKLLENICYLQLQRMKNAQTEIYYYKHKINKKECDFIIQERDSITQAIQVCYAINEDNRKREIDGLLEAMNEHSLSEGTIITMDQEEEIRIDGKKILLRPVVAWLLDK